MFDNGRHRNPDPGWHGPTAARPAAPHRSAARADARPRPDRRRIAFLSAAGVALLGALGAAWIMSTTGATDAPPAAQVVALVQAPVAAPAGTPPGPAGPAGPAPAPVRATVLDIPTLGVHGDLIDLGVNRAGVLQAPPSPDVAGWFTGAAVPGEVGPSVIAGHVDSKAGPGVFYRLKDLAPGDEVEVGRSDGRTARYRVTHVVTVAKRAFPTREVYGPTAGPELRLITCGGEFDRSAGHYLRNVVVSAVLVDPT